MASVLSNCRCSVKTLFDELVQGHRDSEPPPCVDATKASGRKSVPPPRRRRAEPCFWEPSYDEPRLAELASALAPPDVHAQPPWIDGEARRPPTLDRSGTSEWPPVGDAAGVGARIGSNEPASRSMLDDEPPPRPRPPSSIAPVAMPAMALDLAEPPPPQGFARTAGRLAPVSAGVLALGAMAVAGGWGLASGESPSWIGVQALSAPPTDPLSSEADDPIAASLGSDLLTEGALVAQVLIEGPAMAPAELDAEPAEQARTKAPLGSATADPRASGPATPRAITPPRGSRSPRAWMAASRLGQASGRHVGREPSGEPLEQDPTPVAFDAQAARAALQAAAGGVAGCAEPGAGTQLVPVSITFAPSGRATAVEVGGALSGTSSGSCVARQMRASSVPPFSGAAVTVSKTIRVP